MCGRFVVKGSTLEIVSHFGIETKFFDIKPSYNIAPSQPVPIVLHENEQNMLTLMRWGLIPSWAKDPSIGYKTINARSETVAQKPSFRDAFRNRRCIVVANGYYEWIKEGKKKRPMYIHATSGEFLAFAGLWERWRSPQNKVWETCTILTTDANEKMHDIHHRMPVLLPPQERHTWMSGDTHPEQLQTLLHPCDNDYLTSYEVSPQVNSPKYNAPDCIAPYTPPSKPTQTSLFPI